MTTSARSLIASVTYTLYELCSSPTRGKNQWPTKPADFKERMDEWIEKMKQLGMIVMKAQVTHPLVQRL